MDLSAFIDSQIKALRSEPSERLPRPVGCLVVEKVATQSIAASAGIRKGDLLSLVDGSPAARQSPKLYEHRAAKRLLTFYSRPDRAVIELATTGIETGATFDYSAEAIHSRFKPADPDPSAPARLWELGDCAGLLQLSRAALATAGNEQTPALLFEGVGLWEQGEFEAGLERIQHYLTRYGNDWTMNFRATGMHYLGLEALRLGARLRVVWDIDPETDDDALPPLTLQPLVENAIVHGISPRAQPGTVQIACKREPHADVLRVRVSDDGAGCVWPPPPTPGRPPGVGLGALIRRFELDYDGRARLDVRSAPGAGFSVEILIPQTDIAP